jgi:hypothetical protein
MLMEVEYLLHQVLNLVLVLLHLRHLRLHQPFDQELLLLHQGDPNQKMVLLQWFLGMEIQLLDHQRLYF